LKLGGPNADVEKIRRDQFAASLKNWNDYFQALLRIKLQAINDDAAVAEAALKVQERAAQSEAGFREAQIRLRALPGTEFQTAQAIAGVQRGAVERRIKFESEREMTPEEAALLRQEQTQRESLALEEAAQRTRERTLQRGLELLNAEHGLTESIMALRSGPGGEVATAQLVYRLRLESLQTEYRATHDLGQLQQQQAMAAIEHAQRLLEIERQRQQQQRAEAGQLFDAMWSRGTRGIGEFFHQQMIGQLRTIFENAYVELRRNVSNPAGGIIPGQRDAQGQPTLLGRILAGTIAAPDDAKQIQRAVLEAQVTNTKALQDLTAVIEGYRSGRTVPLPGGPLAGMPVPVGGGAEAPDANAQFDPGGGKWGGDWTGTPWEPKHHWWDVFMGRGTGNVYGGVRYPPGRYPMDEKPPWDMGTAGQAQQLPGSLGTILGRLGIHIPGQAGRPQDIGQQGTIDRTVQQYYSDFNQFVTNLLPASTKATTDNTAATIDNTAALKALTQQLATQRALSQGSGQSSGAGQALGQIAGAAIGAAAASGGGGGGAAMAAGDQGGGIPNMMAGFGLGDPAAGGLAAGGTGGGDLSSLTLGGGTTSAGSGIPGFGLPGFPGGGLPGGVGGGSTGGLGNLSSAAGASKLLGNVALGATGVFDLIGGIKKGGAAGTAGAVGGGLEIAAAVDPEPISKTVLIAAAMISKIVGHFLGTSPAQRQKQLSSLTESTTYRAPIPLNLETDISGRMSDTDIFGNLRTTNLFPREAIIPRVVGWDPLRPNRQITQPYRELYGGSPYPTNPATTMQQLNQVSPTAYEPARPAAAMLPEPAGEIHLHIAMPVKAFDHMDVIKAGPKIAEATRRAFASNQGLIAEVRRIAGR
jgi:hypothetical protein